MAKKKIILDRGFLVFLQALQVMLVQYGILQTRLKLLPTTLFDNIYSFITNNEGMVEVRKGEDS